MPVGYRSSSSSGASDAFAASRTVPVPAGAAAGDIAILVLEQWESGNPAVTWPTGFTQIVNLASGSQKLKAAWKRLTGADSGNYTISWTGSQWNQGQCILLTGAAASGDPIGSNVNTATGSTTSIATTSLTVSDAAGFVHVVANENSATKTAPTNFTEVQDANYLAINYRLPNASGTYSAAGGTLSTATLGLAALIAISPDTGGGATDKPVTDSATATDSSATSSTLTPTDTATVTDTGALALARTDTATVTDTIIVSPAVTPTDSATVSETAATSSAAGLVDAATLTDSSALTATDTGADTGTLIDGSAIQVAGTTVNGTDAGTVAEQTTVLTATLPLVDSSTLADNSAAAATLAVVDTGATTDASVVQVAGTSPAVTDGATLAEATAALTATLAAVDGGVLAELAALTAAEAVADTIAGADSSAVAVSAQRAVADAVAVAELAAVVASVPTLEQLGLTEQLQIFATLARVDGWVLAELGIVGLPAADIPPSLLAAVGQDTRWSAVGRALERYAAGGRGGRYAARGIEEA